MWNERKKSLQNTTKESVGRGHTFAGIKISLWLLQRYRTYTSLLLIIMWRVTKAGDDDTVMCAGDDTARTIIITTIILLLLLRGNVNIPIRHDCHFEYWTATCYWCTALLYVHYSCDFVTSLISTYLDKIKTHVIHLRSVP